MHPVFGQIIFDYACYEGRDYVQARAKKGLTDQQIWDWCDRPEWMIWMVRKCINPIYSIKHREMMQAIVQKVVDEFEVNLNDLPADSKLRTPYYDTYASTVMFELVACCKISGMSVCNSIRKQFPEVTMLIDMYNKTHKED